MRRRVHPQLAFTNADWRQVEAVRENPSLPYRELVAHAVVPGQAVAICGITVVHAVPRSKFRHPLVEEQWGPIRICTRCAEADSSV
jgi:hypothetical protein